ncbi:MAG: hypothetical protein JOZ29_09270 [Deltaproteobacteria bacterium]|nr:hypothetical protein [Deltaproteobacteria bacterium]MBV8452448.1 hypothetical protein [Deltaproteobacteria bacterium]
MSFNLWTVQGAWFWSLVYPDRHGGAIGAATSKAEAVGEAQAVIDRFPQPHDDTLLVPRGDSRFTRQFQGSKDSQFHIGSKIDGGTNDFACSHAPRKRSSRMRTMGESYNNLWQRTLRQYAARVAAA